MKSLRTDFKFLLSFLVFILINTGCKSIVEKNRRIVIVLLDYSASNNNSILDNNIQVINETIFSNLNQYDCLIVVPIDEGSKTKPVKLIYEDLREQNFRKKNDGFAHANDSLSLRFSNYVKDISPKINSILKSQKKVRKEFTNYTDIVGAIQQTSNLIEFNIATTATQDIENFVTGHTSFVNENIIVILSDMIQDSQEYSFNSKKGITDIQSARYLKQLETNGSVPDLKGCKVFVIGATGKTSTQIDNISSFWHEYFKLTNASLMTYGYNGDDKLRRYLKQAN